MAGTPDFQKATQVIDDYFFTSDSELIPISVTSGYVAVSSYQALRIYGKFTGGYGNISVDFADNSNGTNPLESFTWPLPLDTILDVLIPCVGPYVAVTVNNDSASTATATFHSGMSMISVPNVQYLLPVDPGAYQAETSIGAGGYKQVNLPYVAGGPATLSVYPHDTSGDIRATILSLNSNGSHNQAVADITGFTNAGTYRITLPGVPCQLYLQNSGTGGHSVRASLVPG